MLHKTRHTFLVLLSLLSQYTFAQNITGYVVQADDHTKTIPFAKLHFVDLDETVLTDEEGKWTLNYESKGKLHVHVEAIGFERLELDLQLNGNEPLFIGLHFEHHHLDKVLVSNDGLLQRESIANVERQDLKLLQSQGAPTLGEALENITGVTQTTTGSGISKPVVRGLSGARVVTYLNALRIQNQQWGGDHGLPIMDVGLGGVEVIKGPASLMYGADALGGVVYFVDEPYAQKNSTELMANTSFHTANLLTSNSAGFKWAKNQLKINIHAGYDNAADYSTSSGLQVTNSRYHQHSAKAAIGYTTKNSVTNIRYTYYSGRIGIPGHTHDSIIDVSNFLTTNQNRKNNVPAQIVTNHLSSIEHKRFIDKHEISLSVGNTNNGLKEHEEKFTIPDINVNLNTTLLNAKWKLAITDHFNLMIGSQNMLQLNVNDFSAPEQLVQDSRTLDLGGYVLMNYKKGKWRGQWGGRFDRRNIATVSGAGFDFSGFNFAAGFNRLGAISDVRFNVSSGFRAPTVAELLNEGVHHGSNRYEIGNADLQSEKAIQLDGSYALHMDDLELIINPYFNWLRNYVVTVPQDSLIGGYQVFAYEQVPEAILYGLDFGIHYHPHAAHWLHLESSVSSVFAEDMNQTPLTQIPATVINSQVRADFEMAGWFRLKSVAVQHFYYFDQPRVVSTEIATDGYHIVNANLNATMGDNEALQLAVGVRNVLNESYLPHLSNLKRFELTDMGVNGFISLTYNFKHQINKQ